MIHLVVAVLVVLLGACGGDSETAAVRTPAAPRLTPTATPTSESGIVSRGARVFSPSPAEEGTTEPAPAESPEPPAQSEPSAGCLEAWGAFGAINDFQDSLEDVVPTLFACSNVKEWIQAGKATPGHSLIVARLTAENLCRGQPGAEGAPVCESL
jgi:hypothetical protein